MTLSKTMPELLLELLQELESIGIDNEEIYDSVCRERMGDPIWGLFICPVTEYKWADDFGLYSESSNQKVKQALQTYINEANKIASNSFTTFHKRLAAFQDKSVKTDGTIAFDDFFGWVNPNWFDASGRVIRSLQEKTWYLQQVLYKLLEELEAISIENPEIHTPVCRKRMSDLIWQEFILSACKHKCSDDFGLSNDIANQKFQKVLQEYVNEVKQEMSSVPLSFHQRLAIFQDKSVITYNRKSCVDDFFNWRDPDGFDAVGKWYGVDKKIMFLDEEKTEDESIELYPIPKGQLSLFNLEMYLDFYPVPEGQLSLFNNLEI